MTNFNFDEPQSESCNNNLFENYDNTQLDRNRKDYTPPNMIDFGKKTQSVMDHFKKCEEIEFDDSKIISFVISLIKKQRGIFHKFVNGSIKLSDNLGDYSIDILFFADRFNNDRYSDEEFLELLHDLLIKSEENKRLTEELKNILVTEEESVNKVEDLEDLNKILENIKNYEPTNFGIKNKLVIIENILSKYIEMIKEYPCLIDSDTKFKIIKEKIKKNVCQENTYAHAKIATIAGIGCLIAAGPAAAATVVATEGIATFLGTASALHTFIGFVEHIKSKIKEGSINDLNKELNTEVSELIEKIKPFTKNLKLIILEIDVIGRFWENQSNRIKDLIKKLERFEGEKRHKKDQIVYSIETKWKDVERECQIYSQVMDDLLTKEKLSLK
jgi:hypothetical protein